jgi:hypothetical protein
MKKLLFILVGLISVGYAQTIQYIGAPTTTVISKGNFRSDSLFYLPKRTKLPTDSGAVRYQISDSSVYYWSGFQWLKLGVNIDTASMLNPYVRGSGTANYLPKFNASRSIVDSKVYETGTSLLFNTTTPSVGVSGYGTFDLNGTTASLLAFKKGDTARGYIGHNGATMDINNTQAGDIRFYTSSTLRGRFQTDGTFRLNSLTGTGTRSVVADANGVLSAGSSPTDLIDTTYISTRAWRQKGDDSLGAIIATKGSGTVTSVATGYGLSGGTITTTGTIIADSAIVASRLRVGKVVDSLALVKQNVLTNPVTGTGTSGQISYWNGTTTQTGENAFFYDDANDRLGIGTTSPTTRISIAAGTGLTFGLSLSPSGWNNARHRFTVPSSGNESVWSWNYDGSSVDFASYTPASIAVGNEGVKFFAASSGVAPTERARVTSFGELLLNTTTDAGDYKLQVSGNAYVSGSTTLGSTIIANNTPFITGSNIYAGNSMAIGTNTSNFVEFYTNNTSRMVILSGGDVLVNSTSDQGDFRFQVNGNSYISGIQSIGTASPSASAQLDVASTTRGFLPPRMTTTQRDAISSPAAGLVIYNTTTSKLQVYTTSWTDLH